MIKASMIWILAIMTGQMSTTVAPVFTPLYATEKEVTCEAQKAEWIKRMPAYKDRLVCLPHNAKDLEPMLYRM